MVCEMAEWAVEKQLWANRREDVLERLHQESASGAQIYVASSVYAPMVEAFAKRFGAKAIGTPVEIQEGKLKISAAAGG